MTVINHTHGFVFVHVPKNAGSSVGRYLSQLTTYRDQEIGVSKLGEAAAGEFRRRFGLSKHSTYREIEAAMGADELRSYTTIAVARNPFDRVRSMYGFLRRWDYWRTLESLEQYADAFDAHPDIDSFVASEFFMTTGPDRLFLPQVTWLADDTGSELRVDHLLRLESLDEDMLRLVIDLGLPQERLGSLAEHRVNVTVKPPAERFNSASERRIRERYHRDFELLGYDGSQPAVAR